MIAPDVLGVIAECPEALNGSEEDIFEARVRLEMAANHDQRGETIQVELLLAGRTLSITCAGVTPKDAVDAVLRELESRLLAFWNRQRRKRLTPPGFNTP